MPMQPPMPQGQMQQQSVMSNPQLFGQLMQQMGVQPPNLQGPTQTPMPGQPMMGPQQGGMPPQGMPPGAQGGMPPQGMQPQAGQSPMQAAGGPAQMQGQGPMQMSPQMQQMLMQRMQQMKQGGQQSRFTPQELGALGRMGDSTIAHLTPGEMTVPPQVQTPKVLATLKNEYNKKGVDPSQFTVGSPSSSVNPQTGIPEYNFWSSVLPMALGIGGSMFGGPLVAGALGSSALAGSAIAGGLGTTLGGIMAGQDPGQAALVGGFGALGDYGLGSLFTGGGAAAEAAGAGGAAEAAANPAINSFAQDAMPTTSMGANSQSANAFTGGGQGAGAQGSQQVGPTVANQAKAGMPMGTPANSGWGGIDARVKANELAGTPRGIGNMFGSGINAGSMVGGALGGMLGESIYGGNANPPQPKGFDSPYKTADQLPSWQQQIGQTSYGGPLPNFSGYNPMTNNPAQHSFFPVR